MLYQERSQKTSLHNKQPHYFNKVVLLQFGTEGIFKYNYNSYKNLYNVKTNIYWLNRG